MNSKDLAKYIEATDSISKPWLLVQLRLQKLQEQKSILPADAYARELADIHQDLMNLGEWWHGIEDEVFWFHIPHPEVPHYVTLANSGFLEELGAMENEKISLRSRCIRSYPFVIPNSQ